MTNPNIEIDFKNTEILDSVEGIESIEMIRKKYDLTHPAIVEALRSSFHITPFLLFSFSAEKEIELGKRKLHINDGAECYTDGSATTLGTNHPTFVGDLDKDFFNATIVCLHESGHDCFTDEAAWKQGIYKFQKEFVNLAGVFRDIMNIYEDRRMEYIIILANKKYRHLFLHIGASSIKSGISLANNMLSTLNGDPLNDASIRLNVIRNLLLWSGYTRVLPVTKDKIVNEYMKKLFPIVLYSRDVKSTWEIVDCVMATADILKDLVDLLKLSPLASSVPTIYVVKAGVGTKKPSSISDLGLDGEPDGDSTSVLKEEGAKIVEDFLDKTDLDGYSISFGGDDSEEESSGSFEKPKGSLNGVSDGNIAAPSDETPTDIASALDNLGCTEEEEISFDEIADTATNEVFDEMPSISEEIYSNYLNSSSDALDSTIKEHNFNLKDKITGANMPGIHDGFLVHFISKNVMQNYSSREYESILKDAKPFITPAVKKLKEILENNQLDRRTHTKSGKLDTSRLTDILAFGANDAFYKEEEIINQLDADFMLLVDASGSQSSRVKNSKNGVSLPRYMLNRLVSVILHEILKEIKYNHAVWSFYSKGKRNIIASMIDDSNCFNKKSGRRLKEIKAAGGNRDGHAIRLAGEYMEKMFSSENKVLFVLSDGQPACTNYYGATAVNDVISANEELTKKGIKVIGIFTGSPSENSLFSTMYENVIFVNNDSLFDLPNILKDEIVKLILRK